MVMVPPGEQVLGLALVSLLRLLNENVAHIAFQVKFWDWAMVEKCIALPVVLRAELRGRLFRE